MCPKTKKWDRKNGPRTPEMAERRQRSPSKKAADAVPALARVPVVKEMPAVGVSKPTVAAKTNQLNIANEFLAYIAECSDDLSVRALGY